MYDGVWSTSNKECVQCSGTKKTKLLADTASIKVDCSGNAPSSTLCETACGANAACDEKNSGACTSSTSLQKCSSSCSPVSSCGDTIINCGEDCEPPNTATCDSTCKSTCTNCANAKSMSLTSISLGETATGTLCSVSSTNANDWFKITTNNNGKLIVEMTPSAADLDLEVDKETFIGGACSNLVNVGISKNGGSAKETVIVDAVKDYTYWIRNYYYSGSATGTIIAKLVECTANNALDAACPSAKPYCASNKCVECITNDLTYFVDANNDGIDDNTNNDRSSQCPATRPRCNIATNVCIVPNPCSTNADCIPDQCCTADSSLGDKADPIPPGGECVGTGTITQPFLCKS